MCGRFVSASPPEEIAEYFGAVLDAAVVDEPLGARFNVAPTLDVYVVYEEGGREAPLTRHVDEFLWGLVPAFAKDTKIGVRMINARAETVATNNSFRTSLARRRCIVPADGFYEWRAVPGQRSKQPYYVRRRDGLQLAFAGLWAEWRGFVDGLAVGAPGDGAAAEPRPVVVRSTTIITTEANETMAPLHDRMPVILPRRAWDRWLDPMMTDVAEVEPLLIPAPPTLLETLPVSTEVGNARNEGAHLIEAIDPADVVGAQQGEQGTLL